MDPMSAAYDEVYVYTMGRPGFILQHVVDAFAVQTANDESKPIRVDCFRRQSPDHHCPVAGIPDQLATAKPSARTLIDRERAGKARMHLA
jgi:hypothetical protein